MKLLNKVGDAMLARLVPGIVARANCGTCRYSHFQCGSGCCRNGSYTDYQNIYMDLCGRVCARVCTTVTCSLDCN
jgi:hypothetical protein